MKLNFTKYLLFSFWSLILLIHSNGLAQERTQKSIEPDPDAVSETAKSKRNGNEIVLNTMGFGIYIGANIANVSATPDFVPAADARGGLIIGAGLEFGITDFFFIEPRFRYTQKGFKQNSFNSGTLTPSTTYRTFKMDYMEFPIMAKIKFPLPMVKPYLTVGPNLGFRVNAIQETESTNPPVISESTLGYIQTIDFSMNFGAGVDYELGFVPFSVFAELDYALGLSNVTTISGNTWRSSCVQFMAGTMVRW